MAGALGCLKRIVYEAMRRAENPRSRGHNSPPPRPITRTPATPCDTGDEVRRHVAGPELGMLHAGGEVRGAGGDAVDLDDVEVFTHPIARGRAAVVAHEIAGRGHDRPECLTRIVCRS